MGWHTPTRASADTFPRSNAFIDTGRWSRDHCPVPNQRSRKRMKSLKSLAGVVCTCLLSSAQVPEVRPQVAGRAVQEAQVTVVYLAPRFATSIRMPDAVNSVVLGDPDSFTAEHSEREPQIVFVKPITAKASQTNLLISTVHGYQANLLLISRGESGGRDRMST